MPCKQCSLIQQSLLINSYPSSGFLLFKSLCCFSASIHFVRSLRLISVISEGQILSTHNLLPQPKTNHLHDDGSTKISNRVHPGIYMALLKPFKTKLKKKAPSINDWSCSGHLIFTYSKKAKFKPKTARSTKVACLQRPAPVKTLALKQALTHHAVSHCKTYSRSAIRYYYYSK